MPRYIDLDDALEVWDVAVKYNPKDVDKKIGIIYNDKCQKCIPSDVVVNFLNKRTICEDVKPVIHAKWEKSVAIYKCSNCKVPIATCIPGFEYCPHCGAKMDEE